MPPLDELPLEIDPGAAAAGPAWRCRICGHVHYGAEPPEECPLCFFPASAFKRVGAPAV
jgi:acyl-CoA dehydrogenase